MKQEVTVCDNCKTQKKQANKWWVGYTATEIDGSLKSLCLWPHDLYPGSSGAKASVDLCGSRCVSEWISRTIL